MLSFNNNKINPNDGYEPPANKFVPGPRDGPGIDPDLGAGHPGVEGVEGGKGETKSKASGGQERKKLVRTWLDLEG